MTTTNDETTHLAWVKGDMLGLMIPAHGEALRAGGEAFLTEAFRAAGALAADNRVVRITRLEECPGGSTGRKQFLSVEYERADPGLHRDLFVKYSRDFDNPIRDRGKDQMESEVKFALLSRAPGFPIAVPACYFADYHHASGTGVLVTQAISFGENGVEPHYEKCLDHHMPEPIGHYRALVKAVARLAGVHKAGGLPATVAQNFPFQAEKMIAADPIRYTPEQLQNRARRIGEFAAEHPTIFPAEITAPAFLEGVARDIPRFVEHQRRIKEYLYANPDYIALCHWNANIDNAWFWRDEAGEVQCGLMDWGRVNQMNMALALWGGLSGAEKEMWDEHLDELLDLFVAEFRRYGGPPIEAQELKFNMGLFVALLGLSWLMDGPALIRKVLPEVAQARGRHDPLFETNETARTQVYMVTNFLNLWRCLDFGAQLDELLRRTGGAQAVREPAQVRS